MTRRPYTSGLSQASLALEQTAAWAAQAPNELGAHAFHAARLQEREQLPYLPTLYRMVRAGTEAGLAEAYSLRRVLHGFAAAAAGHPEPPAHLEEGRG